MTPGEATPALALLLCAPLVGIVVRCLMHPDERARRAHRRRLRAARRHNNLQRRAS